MTNYTPHVKLRYIHRQSLTALAEVLKGICAFIIQTLTHKSYADKTFFVLSNPMTDKSVFGKFGLIAVTNQLKWLKSVKKDILLIRYSEDKIAVSVEMML